MEQEIWKPIEGYEGLYEVSNLGRVRSLEREIHRRKVGTTKVKESILKGRRDKRGYLSVDLHKTGQYKEGWRINRLVAIAFIPNPENKPFVDHINGIPSDNRVCNLRWCTPKENMNFELAKKHSSECKLGDKNPMYGREGKESPSHKGVLQYDLQGNFIKKYYGIAEAQRETGVIFQNISKVCKGERNTAGGYIWRFEDEPLAIEKSRMVIETKTGIKKYLIKKSGFGSDKIKHKRAV